jgi:hypothetical protein
MVIQLIPKQQERVSFFKDILLYFSLILLVAAAASCFVLNNFQQKLENDISILDKELAAAEASPEAALEKVVLNYEKKISDFSGLLNGYHYSSQVFLFIEKLTHPKVVFSDFEAQNYENSIQLSGKTDGFLSLGQQLIIFKNEKLIKEVKLSNISLEKGGKVSFSFNLLLDPGIFILSE